VNSRPKKISFNFEIISSTDSWNRDVTERAFRFGVFDKIFYFGRMKLKIIFVTMPIFGRVVDKIIVGGANANGNIIMEGQLLPRYGGDTVWRTQRLLVCNFLVIKNPENWKKNIFLNFFFKSNIPELINC
jgi:hypothetical protein